VQTDELEQFDALTLAAARAGQALVQLEQLVGGHPAGKTKELGEVAERSASLTRACTRTAHFRAPRRRPDETAGDLDEGGLSGTVRPEQTDELALTDLEIHTAERFDRAVTLDEAADGERCGHDAERTLSVVPRGYEEGPVAEEAEARRDALARGERLEPLPHAPGRRAVYGSTDEEPEKHFLGWADEVDPDELFESGRAWGITVLRERAD
jgi:hypothetical protein